jgi:hypothetical protein
MQRVKVEPREVQVPQRLCLMQYIQDTQRPFLKVWPYSRAGAREIQIAQTFMAEALYHIKKCSASRNMCKPMLYI